MTGLVALITGLFIVLFIVAIGLIGGAALIAILFAVTYPFVWLAQVFRNVAKES